MLNAQLSDRFAIDSDSRHASRRGEGRQQSGVMRAVVRGIDRNRGMGLARDLVGQAVCAR
jgi:hypothetical protein